MIVVDAPVLTNAFTDDGPVGTGSRAELARDAYWAGPEHLVVEVFSAVRGRWLGQKISEKRAEDALTAMMTTTIDLVATTPLLARTWELRSNVTGYDAAYLAVAETLGCAFVTADARLAQVPDLRCEVRLATPPPRARRRPRRRWWPAPAQIPWPPPGNSRGRQRAGFMSATGQFPLSLDRCVWDAADWTQSLGGWRMCERHARPESGCPLAPA